MKKQLIGLVATGVLALPLAASAAEISVSGHLNRAIVFGDDMVTGENDVDHRDGGASPSRFRFTGSEELGGEMTAGVNLEYGVGGTKADSNPNLRHSAIYLSGAFGKLTLGHTSQATDSIAYSTYDKHAWLAGIEVGCDFCSGLPSYGGSRSQVIRYDTPPLGDGVVSVSADGNDFWDAAIRVDGAVGNGGYQLKLGYGATDDKQQNLVASGAVKLPGGAHLGAAWGQSNPDAKGASNLNYWHAGIGYNLPGGTSLAATYIDHDDKGGTKSWGLGVGHGMGQLQLYAGYKHLSYDKEVPGSQEDHGFFVVGSRLKFN